MCCYLNVQFQGQRVKWCTYLHASTYVHTPMHSLHTHIFENSPYHCHVTTWVIHTFKRLCQPFTRGCKSLQKESSRFKSSNSNGIASFGNLHQCHWCKSCDNVRRFDSSDDSGCPAFYRNIYALEMLTKMPARNINDIHMFNSPCNYSW